MKHTTRMHRDEAAFRPRRSAPRPAFGLAGAALATLAGIVFIDARPAVAPDHPPSPHRNEATARTAPDTDPVSAALLDANYSLGPAPVVMAERSPLPATLEPMRAAPRLALLEPDDVAAAEPEPVPSPLVQQEQGAPDVPLPPARPADIQIAIHAFRVPGRQSAMRSEATGASPKTFDDRSFFEKFFGGLQQPAGPALGYAAPEEGLFGTHQRLTPDPTPTRDQWTAVYDISAHTVYMPNGARLEAHSGLGARLDDPRFVHERMRGPTPPHLYDLTPREQLFHGVRALRLNPVGNGTVFGRTGLLAHTFMLGPNGDSNGCVSFRDYDAFLRAYQNGEVKRLVVVARQS